MLLAFLPKLTDVKPKHNHLAYHANLLTSSLQTVVILSIMSYLFRTYAGDVLRTNARNRDSLRLRTVYGQFG